MKELEIFGITIFMLLSLLGLYIVIIYAAQTIIEMKQYLKDKLKK